MFQGNTDNPLASESQDRTFDKNHQADLTHSAADNQNKMILESRQRNREAVARSRAKKNSRLEELQSMVELLKTEKSCLSQQLAISLSEKQVVESRRQEMISRIEKLENVISSREEKAHKH